MTCCVLFFCFWIFFWSSSHSDIEDRSWTQLKNCLVIFDTSGSKSWPLVPLNPSFQDSTVVTGGHRWSPVLQRDEAFLIHIQLRKERSNLAWNSSGFQSKLIATSRHFMAVPTSAQRISQVPPVTPMDLARFTNSPFGTRPTWQAWRFLFDQVIGCSKVRWFTLW